MKKCSICGEAATAQCMICGGILCDDCAKQHYKLFGYTGFEKEIRRLEPKCQKSE